MAYQIDRSRCLCCHNCALECPKEAIRYQGTGYVIDAGSCVDCGHCAKVCNVDAVSQVGAVQAQPEAHAPRELSCEIVVLGAGAAGIVAAARAADLCGGNVIVLEKAKKYGGSGWFAGFSVPVEGEPSSMPPMFREAQETLKKGGIDPELIDMAQAAPSAFFRWFRKLDPRVDEIWEPRRSPFGASMEMKERRVFFNKKSTDNTIGPGRSTSVMEKIVTDHFSELGVTLLTEHAAERILTDETGAVCGVEAKDPGGIVRISCKAVITCTGGYANNEELLRTYAPQYYGAPADEPTHRFAAPTNTGDVMKLGESAGAYLDTENFTANVFGPVHHPFSFCLFSFANQPEIIHVNLEGKRFTDESIFGGAAAAMYHQPGRIAWSVLDHKTRRQIADRLTYGPDGDLMMDYEAVFEEEAAMDTPLKTADSLEELAELCGMDKTAFLETVRTYNEDCRKGQDRAFGKRPETMRPIEEGPFYAIFGKIACDGAFGGMLVNSRTEVFKADRTGVIPGLYAAGDNSSGWLLKSKEEGDHRLMAAGECSWAIGSGFTAGEQAAAYLAEI